ncbi:MAG: hypothetical protein M9953_10280 [Thermomicrobiales bacterium]|nr:hypothetical protein [Thermomicrobiales bacterium]MCO5225717.1 hypothetical protein [Thermomicrobiales bacterium]MCO5227932.1 hypothetical protein [Thermomicrobiales bacterium]
MAQKAVKMPVDTHMRLLRIAKEDGVSMGELVTELVDELETRRFWQGVKEDYERLNADPVAKAQYDADLAEWDAFGNDILDLEEPYEVRLVEKG